MLANDESTKIPFDSAYEIYSVDDVRTVRNDSRSDYIDPILLEPHLYDIEILDGTDELLFSQYQL
jgi:hypothetical protein